MAEGPKDYRNHDWGTIAKGSLFRLFIWVVLANIVYSLFGKTAVLIFFLLSFFYFLNWFFNLD